MFYWVEIECANIEAKNKYKWIIYLEDPDLAKKTLYNNMAKRYNITILFKTFRKATEEEITKYVRDEGDDFAKPLLLTNERPYYFICSI